MTAEMLLNPAVDGITERFDPIDCLDERVRNEAASVDPTEPGRYIEVQGADRRLVVPLGEEVLRIGRGLAADLRIDEASVSRRHAILAPREQGGTRVLDDRSSNGTFVNGRRVHQRDLRDGDVIALGRVTLRYMETPGA